jgi:ssRNA-specific RNase YbeY (16S rRNA maturation enzyme)
MSSVNISASLGGKKTVYGSKAVREAKKFDHSPQKHITFLFIHGCLHLAGHAHGGTMEALEQKYLRKFSK